MSSYTNKLLYPLYTHCMGAAEYGNEVINDKTYVNKVRLESNSYARTLQRGKRLFSLSKQIIYAVGLYLLIKYL